MSAFQAESPVAHGEGNVPTVTLELPDAIAAASAIGNLQKVEELFETLSTTRGMNPVVLNELEVPLYEAVIHGHAAVVSYLLDKGVNITRWILGGATEAQSTSVFQALLDHGWDINSRWVVV